MSTASWIELSSIILIVLWNGFFVAAEYAFVTVRRTRLQELVEQGSRRAPVGAHDRRGPDALHLGDAARRDALVAWRSAPSASRPSRASSSRALGLSGAARRGVAGTLAIIVAFAIITTLHVVLGEIVPKTIGLGRAERVALWVAGPCGSSSASSSRSSGRSSAWRAWSTAGSG